MLRKLFSGGGEKKTLPKKNEKNAEQTDGCNDAGTDESCAANVQDTAPIFTSKALDDPILTTTLARSHAQPLAASSSSSSVSSAPRTSVAAPALHKLGVDPKLLAAAQVAYVVCDSMVYGIGFWVIGSRAGALS